MWKPQLRQIILPATDWANLMKTRHLVMHQVATAGTRIFIGHEVTRVVSVYGFGTVKLQVEPIE